MGKELKAEHIVRYFYKLKGLPQPTRIKAARDRQMITALVEAGWSLPQMIRALDYGVGKGVMRSLGLLEEMLYEAEELSGKEKHTLERDAKFCYLYQSDYANCGAERYGAVQPACKVCKESRHKWIQ